MSATGHKETVQAFYGIGDGVAQGRISPEDVARRAGELFSRDLITHIGSRALHGVDAFMGAAHDHAKAFPGFEHEIVQQVEEDYVVFTRAIFRARHGGSYMGVAATGNRVETNAYGVHRFGADGRIAEQWLALDASVMEQIIGLRSAD